MTGRSYGISFLPTADTMLSNSTSGETTTTTTTSSIAGYAASALASLTESQLTFIKALPKAELHAHLNGSIPLHVLRSLAQDYSFNTPPETDSPPTTTNPIQPTQTPTLPAHIAALLEKLQSGVELNEIHDFFSLFPAIYALTSTPESLQKATRAVLHEFLDGPDPQAAYLELRTTPRETFAMDRRSYVLAVLSEIERYRPDEAALIVSLDRRMDDRVLGECVDIARGLKAEGRRVVGVDVCGDPLAGDVETIVRHLRDAKRAGLKVTVHVAETAENTKEDTMALLSCQPDRLGHATFLDQEAQDVVLANKICIEICLSSNLICKTITSLNDHHIRYYLKHHHPVAICTDDILPFRNSMTGEYALLMAQPPLGLGLSMNEISRLARMSMQSRFIAAS